MQLNSLLFLEEGKWIRSILSLAILHPFIPRITNTALRASSGCLGQYAITTRGTIATCGTIGDGARIDGRDSTA